MLCSCIVVADLNAVSTFSLCANLDSRFLFSCCGFIAMTSHVHVVRTGFNVPFGSRWYDDDQPCCNSQNYTTTNSLTLPPRHGLNPSLGECRGNRD